MNKNENIQSAGANSAKLQNSSNNNNVIEALKQQQKEIFKAQKEERIKEKNPFPIEVFPEIMQLIINKLKENNQFPIDFTATAMLYACAVAIGSSLKVYAKENYIQSVTFYFAIVGLTGTNKTAPLKTILNPLNQLDRESYEAFKKQLIEYEALKNDNSEPIKKPIFEQKLITDFTIESLALILQNNPKGVGIYVDELDGFFKSFNRYNKGNDLQTYLTLHDNGDIPINRKKDPPIYIKDPYISIIGTIQPKIAYDLFKNAKESGLADRFLLAYPDNLKKEHFTLDSIDKQLLKDWNNFILNLNDVTNGEKKTISFTNEALKIASNYINLNTDKYNSSFDNNEKSIYPKMDKYLFRFALLIEAIESTFNNKEILSISKDSVKKAIKLNDYFLHNALKFNNYLNDNINPVEELAENHKIFYSELPEEEFTTAEAHKLAEKLETFKKDQCNKFLRSRTQKGNKKSANDLFENVKHGVYKKLY